MRNSKELVMSRGLKFGVEIEIANNVKAELIRVAGAKGVRVIDMGYTHQVTSGCWKVVPDGSLTSGGFELVSPVLYNMVELEKICEALKEVGAKVDKSCGLHVHHDANDFDTESIKNVYRLYNKYGKVFDSIMPVSRRANMNTFCKDVDTAWLERVESCVSIDDMKGKLANHDRRSTLRYRKVNFCSYLGYGTLEFRQHSGTVEFEKISNWVIITNLIMQRAKEGKKVKATSEARLGKWSESDVHMMYDFYIELGISATEVAEYIRARRKTFKEREVRVA